MENVLFSILLEGFCLYNLPVDYEGWSGSELKSSFSLLVVF